MGRKYKNVMLLIEIIYLFIKNRKITKSNKDEKEKKGWKKMKINLH